MNYITEQLCFLRYLRNHQLSSGEVSLWYALFASSNNNGLGKEFTVSDNLLRLYSGLGQSRLAQARKKLEEAGLLICSPYRPKELRTYRLVSLEKVMSSSQSEEFFLPENESESTMESKGESKQDTNCASKSTSKSASNSTTYIKKKKKEENKKEEQEIEKKAYGPFRNIWLSDEEMTHLQLRIPDPQQLIHRMSLFTESTGKDYQNHYAALLQWWEKDKQNMTPTQLKDQETEALEKAFSLALLQKHRAKFP